jgi:hypothetical protein
MPSAWRSRRRSRSGVRMSASSGKKPRIGSSTPRIRPRSIAMPTASEATLFDTDFSEWSISASKATFATRLPRKLSGTSSRPVK